MPALGAMDPANLLAYSHAELDFLRKIEQPQRTSPLDGCSDGLQQGGFLATAAKMAMMTVMAEATKTTTKDDSGNGGGCNDGGCS
jgi:hypothetical protein